MPEFRIGSIASGMGMHLHGLKQIGGVPAWAIECDEAIAQCYRNNHQGRLYVKKVQDVDPADLADIDLLTVTLSCKNASTAKGANRGETEEDTSAGEAVANIIRAKLPKYFMLENVWGYRNFQAFSLIQEALNECGYYFQIYKFNCKDWGVSQSRDRLYGLAVRGGMFSAPESPQAPIVGWHEAIEDLIPQLPETDLAPWQQKKFPGLVNRINSCLIPDHSNSTKLISEENPAYVVRAGHQTVKALIKRVGGGRKSDRIYQADEPSFTIRALGRGSSNHSRIADAVVNGKIVAVTPRACLRFFGDKETADSIWLPPTKSLAMEVVGNGASWVMFRELFQHLRGADMTYSVSKNNETQILFPTPYSLLPTPCSLLPAKTMFNFPQTQEIAQQIAQMQEQLALLTSSLQPFKELEDTANDLLIQVQVHAQLMREKGVEESSLVDWANQLYSAIGVNPQTDAEAIKVLQAENASLIFKIDELNAHLPEVEALQHELEEVRSYNDVLTDKVQELSSQFSESKSKGKKHSEDTPEVKPENLSDIDARFKGQEFIDEVRFLTKAEVKSLAWTDIEDFCNQDVRVLRGMSVGAKVKVQKEFIESLPKLLADYILDTDDRTPLDWVGESLKSEALVIIQESTSQKEAIA